MKKTLTVIGLILIPFALVVLSVFITIHNGPNVDKESKAWVEDITPKIITNWDTNEALAIASPQLLRDVPASTMRDTFDQIRSDYGALISYGEPQGESGIHVNTLSGQYITAEYVVDAVYAKGQTRIFIQGIKIGDQWKLLQVNVTSDPNLRWFNGHLTDQPTSSPSMVVDGTYYHRIWPW